jgi:hypothetical protein
MTPTHEYAIKLPDGRMLFGYYDSDERAHAAIAPYTDRLVGAWRGLNPLRPDSALLSTLSAPPHRSAHRAGSADILRRSSLLIDFDAACPSDAMSNEAEHEAAIAQAEHCSDWLAASFGWARQKTIDSGRGCQSHVAVDLPADSDTDALVRDLLRSLKSRYALIDAGMHDRPRLARLPGFWNRKSASPTSDRPHRLAKVIDAGDTAAIVTRAQIESVIAKIGLPAISKYSGTEKPDPAAVDRTIRQLAEWLDRIGVTLTEIVPLSDGRTLLRLNCCPLNPSHNRTSPGIGVSVSGRPLNMCRHTSCGMPFSQWRELVEKKTGVKLTLGRKLIFKIGAK